MMNTKQKGNITEVECMLAFLKLGYNVLTPYGDCERYDFVADVNGILYKVQVKSANDSHIEDGYIEFKTSSKTTKEGSFIRKEYNKDEIDFFMTYYNNQGYLIPIEECATKTDKRLRFTTPKNGQIKGITFASEYEIEKVVENLTRK